MSIDSIRSRALDVEALGIIARFNERSEVVTLPRLHAKVFVADVEAAIVTSANMTRPGIDANYEYGLGVSDRATVRAIRSDIEAYARLGSPLDARAFEDLAATATRIIEHARQVEHSTPLALRAQFRATLREAHKRLARLPVGRRTSNEVFGEAIRFVLAGGPMTTQVLESEVQRLMPDQCDDSVELIINAERYGKEWKHRLRNAQQSLKRRNEIQRDPASRRWSLTAR